MPKIDEKQMVLEFTATGRYCANVNPVIEEVFANLLSNAIKYGPEKSRIIIDIIDAGEEWRVTVTDFGEGISDEDKTRLFERFRRANRKDVKGTGLGLAIVKRLITLHGGRVGVEDNPEGQGSRFWVTVKKA
jgi:signal transduction histidine kinase